MEWQAEINPFSKEYYQRELAFFNTRVKEISYGDIRIEMKDYYGRIDGYMYRTWGGLSRFPVST
jgi:hypothetical protein